MAWMTRAEMVMAGLTRVGVGCKIDQRAVIMGGESIEIGDNVRIDCGAKLLAGGKHANIRIGSHCHIATDAVLMSAGGIEIGSHCCVGIGSKLISASDSFSGHFLIGPQYGGEPYTCVRAGRIVMHDHASVTTDCVLLPGSIMDIGSVLGARTLLKGQTQAWVIYVGSPAKPVANNRSTKAMELAQQWEQNWVFKRAEIDKLEREESKTSPRRGKQSSASESAAPP